MPTQAIGHHGTSIISAEKIVSEGFNISSRPEDWLGDGAYFFQDAPKRALEWSVKRYADRAAVVEADIKLDNFLDFLDIEWTNWLADVHDRYVSELKVAGQMAPTQAGGAHRLDRAVLNYAVEILRLDGMHVAGVRGAFVEGAPVFANSALFTRSHVQIAVRDLSAIVNPRIIFPT